METDLRDKKKIAVGSAEGREMIQRFDTLINSGARSLKFYFEGVEEGIGGRESITKQKIYQGGVGAATTNGVRVRTSDAQYMAARVSVRALHYTLQFVARKKTI